MFARPSSLRRLALAGLLVASAGLVQGCASRDGMSTGAIPDDYRSRHPITLSEAEHTLDVPIASGDSRLTVGVSDAIRGFAASYASSSSGSIVIMTPDGSANSAASANARKQIRTVLTGAGVPARKISETRYAATGSSAPIRLSYMAITAMTHPCGNWPEDLSNDTFSNKNWQNFGCASQSNMAAQIANPMDLVTPRGMSPIDAERRSNVIGLYREGSNTATTE
jgi:pilus assembly protein CpaD